MIGPPFIRRMPNISVIHGQTLIYRYILSIKKILLLFNYKYFEIYLNRCPVVQIEAKDPKIIWTKGMQHFYNQEVSDRSINEHQMSFIIMFVIYLILF